VRYIGFEEIAEAVKSLCIVAAYELPIDVLAALEKAAQRETNPAAVKVLNQLVENARIAKERKIPLCQDTGLAVVFVEQGENVVVDMGFRKAGSLSVQHIADREKPNTERCSPNAVLFDAINAGVAVGYEKGYLRKSVVAEPLRGTTDDRRQANSVPAIIHHTIVPGDKLKITVMAKGGGCENKSAVAMFKPTADRSEIIDWVVSVVKAAGADACPPFIVGVGIGGDFEFSCLLSKKALLRDMGEENSNKFYADLESDLLSAINALGLGPQGLGGDTTALAVQVETAPCHIASLPVAVNIECHSHRHKSVVI
jgi:fumarate hydratase subunit alpha